MRRKDFINEVLNIIGGTPTGYYDVFCDRSQSSDPEKRNNEYFMRFKFPCFSDKVYKKFYIYGTQIKDLLDEIKAGKTKVKLNKSRCRGEDFYYIEVIFMAGLPWRNNKSIMPQPKRKIKHVEDFPSEVEFSSHPSQQNKVTIEKSKLANLIRMAIKNNSNLSIGDLSDADDDILIELFKQISK